MDNLDYSVLSTGGDHNLGGIDWDTQIVNFFAERFIQKYGDENDPRADPAVRQELQIRAEEGKKALTQLNKYKMTVFHQGKKLDIELTKEMFEERTKDLLSRTIEITKNIVADAQKKGFSGIDQILLVGGSCRMPLIANAISQAFHQKPLVIQPEYAIIKGTVILSETWELGNEIRKIPQISRYIKVGIFSDGDLVFKRPAQMIYFEDEYQQLFLELLPETEIVDSISDEYIHIMHSPCSCSGVFWPTLIFMAIRKGMQYYDLMYTHCIICGQKKPFLFDISRFYLKKEPEEDYERQIKKVDRVKEVLNTNAFHRLTEAISGKNIYEDGHYEMYSILREQYDMAGIAKIDLCKDEKIQQKLIEWSKRRTGK